MHCIQYQCAGNVTTCNTSGTSRLLIKQHCNMYNTLVYGAVNGIPCSSNYGACNAIPCSTLELMSFIGTTMHFNAFQCTALLGVNALEHNSSNPSCTSWQIGVKWRKETNPEQKLPFVAEGWKIPVTSCKTSGGVESRRACMKLGVK